MRKSIFKFFLLMSLFAVVLAGCSTNQSNDTGTDSAVNQPSKTESDDKEKNEQEVKKYYFTANEGGSINKIDAVTNEVAATIEADGAVHNVQVSPDGKIFGATVVPEMQHGGNESMEMKGLAVFYNSETNELLKTVEVGNHPAHIVFTQDGKYAYVTNNEDNNVTVIETKNYSVVNTISTGKGPHGFRISKDSKWAYVANIGEDTVSVLNLETMKEEKKITVGSTPVTTGITSDGKTLVATLNAENALAIVDLETNKVDKVEVGKGPAQVYIDSSNQFAYVANQGTEDSPSNTVTIVDIPSKKAVSTIETGKGSHGVVTSQDNKFAYVTNMYENTVSVINTEQRKIIKTIEVDKIPNGISIMP